MNPGGREVPAGCPQPIWMLVAAVALSLGVLGFYARAYEPKLGWTRLVDFGANFADVSLPRLKRSPHSTVPNGGNDGQFYAQIAIDPSLQDRAFDHALDNPAYRARRIALPALSFCLGWAKPRRVIQAYALSNLIFWFVLLGALVALSRPWTGRQVLCCAVPLVSFGVITSLEKSMVDLPTTAILLAGLLLGLRGRFAALAAAILTRETSMMAACGFVDSPRPAGAAGWKRPLTALALTTLPFAGWVLYVGHRFHGLHGTAGSGNFAFPLQAMGERFLAGWREFVDAGLGVRAKAAGLFGWLYLDENVHEVLAVMALFCQGSYFLVRRQTDSPFWRIGIGYVVLGSVLGPAVWGWTAAAARVLLPMTVCFYLLIGRERGRWFWPFFLAGSLPVPYSVYDFWTYS